MLGKRRAQTEGRVKSQANLQKLLLADRVKIDPVTKMPVMPRRNVLYMDTVKMTGRQREVNGGHAKADNSIWRIALGGPARYVWKLMRDETNARIKGTRVISAPTLTEEEHREAREFVSYLLSLRAENKSPLPDDFLSQKYDYDQKTRETFGRLDEEFYVWKKKQEKVELARLSDVFAFLPV